MAAQTGPSGFFFKEDMELGDVGKCSGSERRGRVTMIKVQSKTFSASYKIKRKILLRWVGLIMKTAA